MSDVSATPPRDIPDGFVVVYHPDLDATGEVHESTLPLYRDAGWQLVTDDGDVVALPAAVDPSYDPSGHTVAEVLDYLAELDDDGRAAVLVAEREGKARSGVLAALDHQPPTSEDGE